MVDSKMHVKRRWYHFAVAQQVTALLQATTHLDKVLWYFDLVVLPKPGDDNNCLAQPTSLVTLVLGYQLGCHSSIQCGFAGTIWESQTKLHSPLSKWATPYPTCWDAFNGRVLL